MVANGSPGLVKFVRKLTLLSYWQESALLYVCLGPAEALAGPDGLPLTSTGVWWNHLTTKPRGTVGAWTSIRIANHHLPPGGLFPGDAMEPPRWTPEAVEIQSWKIRGPKACNCLIGRPHSLNYSCRPLFPYLAVRTDENTNQKKKACAYVYVHAPARAHSLLIIETENPCLWFVVPWFAASFFPLPTAWPLCWSRGTQLSRRCGSTFFGFSAHWQAVESKTLPLIRSASPRWALSSLQLGENKFSRCLVNPLNYHPVCISEAGSAVDSQQEAAEFNSSSGLSAWGLYVLAVPGRVLSGTPTSSHNLKGKSGQLAAP